MIASLLAFGVTAVIPLVDLLHHFDSLAHEEDPEAEGGGVDGGKGVEQRGYAVENVGRDKVLVAVGAAV